MNEEHPVIAGFKLTWRAFSAPGVAEETSEQRSFGMWVLEDPNAPLDQITQEEFDHHDERMPYFGLIWPAAESLVTKILAGPRLDRVRVLDLGCGLGPCGFAAAARGAHVTFFDWEPRAIEIAAASARDQHLPAEHIALVTGDWRRPPPLGPFELVLGADVLYEERNAPAVAAFLGSHLRPGAEAWIADPGRRHAEGFPQLARETGLELVGEEALPAAEHGRQIVLRRLRRCA
jgi:2-polyprenyl-3-methyl-5-hydroxy-6-metoxy-1,4-benzoquinol methylase